MPAFLCTPSPHYLHLSLQESDHPPLHVSLPRQPGQVWGRGSARWRDSSFQHICWWEGVNSFCPAVLCGTWYGYDRGACPAARWQTLWVAAVSFLLATALAQSLTSEVYMVVTPISADLSAFPPLLEGDIMLPGGSAGRQCSATFLQIQ